LNIHSHGSVIDTESYLNQKNMRCLGFNSRRVVGWSMNANMTAQLVTDAFDHGLSPMEFENKVGLA